MGDGAGDLDALGEATGELRGVGVGAFGEMELSEQLLVLRVASAREKPK